MREKEGKEKMSKESFYFPMIETRSFEKDGIPEYIIRGYAANANHVYAYGRKDGKTLREFFTDDAIKNITRKAKMKGVRIDAFHQLATRTNIKGMLEKLQKKTGTNITEETNYILDRIRNTDVPLFKLNDMKLDEKGWFVDIRMNPFYRNIDDEHKSYFDTVWNSLKQGYINGMSVDIDKESLKFQKVNDTLFQIDDADVLGINLLQGSANDMANITEVAMRCFQDFGGRKECQKKEILM